MIDYKRVPFKAAETQILTQNSIKIKPTTMNLKTAITNYNVKINSMMKKKELVKENSLLVTKSNLIEYKRDFRTGMKKSI